MKKYQDLLALREHLKNQLAEVEADIQKYDLKIYKGKLEKAISLLKECNPLISKLIIIDEYKECDTCEGEINVEIYLERIISELEYTAECFESYARIP